MPRIALPSVFLVVAALAGCGGGADNPAAQGAPGAMPPAEVQTVTLAAVPIAQSSEFVGTVRSLRSTTVQPQVDGIVRQIFVKAGDRVRAGQQILQIDPDRQAATLGATASLEAAREADLAFARQQLARQQTLHDAGAVSRAELEQAENAQKTAEAQLAVVQSLIRESRVQLQYYRVTAPVPGMIGEIPVRQGDRVTPQTPITTIDQSDGLEVLHQRAARARRRCADRPAGRTPRPRWRGTSRPTRSPSSRLVPTTRCSRCW